METFVAILIIALLIAIAIAKSRHDTWKIKDREKRIVHQRDYEIELVNRPFKGSQTRMEEEDRKSKLILSRYPFLPLPANFRENRTMLRGEYRVAISEGSEDRAKEALEKLYLYAQYFVYCYGDDDNRKGVPGYMYTAALDKLYENPWKMEEFKKHSFETDGKIASCYWLSPTDWSHFEKLWGKKEASLIVL